MRTGARSALQWIGISLGALILLLVLVLTFMDWNLLKGPIQRTASARSGRTVAINGDLKVHIWSLSPTVTLTDLVVGNPPWEQNRPMLQVQRMQVQLKLLPLLKGDVILPRVELIKPDVYLHQERSGRANWTFENKAPTKQPASGPTKLPVIRDLLIQSGKMYFADDIRKLKINGTVEAHEKAAKTDATPFHIQGQGSINEQPFDMQIDGGPLVNLDPQHPYPFNLSLTAGEIKAQSDGKVLQPFDLGKLAFEMTVSGNDLAELFYLTQLALPNTPPFKLHVRIERNGMRVAVRDIAGTVGGSDLSGKLDVDATTKRPTVSGELISNRLRMADLAASLGKEPQANASLDKKTAREQPKRPEPKSKAPPPNPNARLFPDARLQVDRVRAMDADVRFRAKSIDAGSVPFKQVALHIKLDDGVLTIDPLAFDMPQGRVTGTVRINAQQDVPKVRLDLRVRDIQLDQLKGKAAAAPPLEGIMQARMVIEGTGDSLHKVMSDANGRFIAVLPNGEVRSAFAELTGINVAEGLGLLIKGSKDQVPIRCGVAQFDIKDGLMQAQNIVFDTQNVKITGKGDIQLGPEQLDMSIKGEPKKPRITRLRTPIEIRGHLLKPSFGVDAGSVVKQGAIAAALGVVATPLAAVLAFVDPGLAKDANCAQMLAEAQSTPSTAPPPPGTAAPKGAQREAAAPPPSTQR